MHTVSLTPPAARRRGFTLIELLAVIAILSILMAFLVPAVLNARRAALVTQVTSDILTFDNAIKSFKNEFGVEPPSMITLSENAAGWSTASQAIIGRLWPQFDFTIGRDLNLDGSISGTYTLTGAECLVFFLGGVTTFADGNSDNLYTAGETVITVNGFSRNPANPFSPLPASGTGNRQGPFYTFNDLNRLIPIKSNSASTPIDFTFAYADPVAGTKVPYLYANSNEGQGYNEDAPSTQVALDFAGVNDARGSMATNYTAHYYRQGPNISTVPSSSPFWNKNGYQIISAGFDRRFGGPSTSGTTPYQFGGDWQKGTGLPTTRDGERDNITNFSSGLLEP